MSIVAQMAQQYISTYTELEEYIEQCREDEEDQELILDIIQIALKRLNK